MTKLLKTLFVFFLLCLLFRGPIFRFFIKYSASGSRSSIQITNKKLISTIEKETKGIQDIPLEKIVSIAKKITIQSLSFTNDKVSSNPNDLFDSGKANCIGYAAMFNSIVQHIFQDQKLLDQYSSKHQIGKLSLFNYDLHQLFTNPFFKDHDYNEIKDLKSGTVISIDLSLSDYLGIDRVQSK